MITIPVVLLIGALLIIALVWVTKNRPLFRLWSTIFLSYLFLVVPFYQLFALCFSIYSASQVLKNSSIYKDKMGVWKFLAVALSLLPALLVMGYLVHRFWITIRMSN